MPIPFSNGTQLLDWEDHNCCNCAKPNCSTGNGCGPDNCEIDTALTEAYWGDGTVSEEIAKRMALPTDVRLYRWRCGEFDDGVRPLPDTAQMTLEVNPLNPKG